MLDLLAGALHDIGSDVLQPLAAGQDLVSLRTKTFIRERHSISRLGLFDYYRDFSFSNKLTEIDLAK